MLDYSVNNKKQRKFQFPCRSKIVVHILIVVLIASLGFYSLNHHWVEGVEGGEGVVQRFMSGDLSHGFCYEPSNTIHILFFFQRGQSPILQTRDIGKLTSFSPRLRIYETYCVIICNRK